MKSGKLYYTLISVIAIFIACTTALHGQNNSIDSASSIEGNKKIEYVGHTIQGLRVDLWTGTESATDSVKCYLIYNDGILMCRYFVHPRYGPLPEFRINSSLDTLIQYSYNSNGKVELISIRKIVSDSLLLKNRLQFSAKEEGAVKSIKRYEYYYNYRGISGLLEIRESNYGGEQYLHYYSENRFICTFNSKGKVIKGSKKRYDEIIKNHK